MTLFSPDGRYKHAALEINSKLCAAVKAVIELYPDENIRELEDLAIHAVNDVVCEIILSKPYPKL
jgi:hypothetical protein